MLSKESIANLGLAKVLGAAWVIFTTLYFLLSIALPYIIQSTQTASAKNMWEVSRERAR